MTDILRNFVAALQEPQRFIFVGGLPRSGTQSMAGYLHAASEVFVFDECHWLLDGGYLSHLKRSSAFFEQEASIWTEGGATWRGLTLEEDRTQRFWSFVTTLAAGTSPGKLLSKSPSTIRTLACKTPGCEAALSILVEHLFVPLTYVHCVRDPADMLQSFWQMIWRADLDEAGFIADITQRLATSLYGYELIPCNKHVFRLGVDQASCLSAALGLAPTTAANELPHQDFWAPADRRRDVATLPASMIEAFEARPEVQQWRKAFNLPRPSA